MPGGPDRYFDGVRWDRAAVVAAQRARAVSYADQMGWSVSAQSLLTDPLTLTAVEQFERVFGVTLPGDYRSFLLQVGDGGCGPGLAMRPLGAPFDDSLAWDAGEIHRGPGEPNEDLSLTFKHIAAVDITPEAAAPELTAGSLYLFDHGCALWDLLVVTGDSAGEIWRDRLSDGDGLRPACDDDGARMGFAAYYCRWLEGG